MYARERCLKDVNKKPCNFTILDDKDFPGENALGLELPGCQYGTAHK
jgi:hypothetical protein